MHGFGQFGFQVGDIRDDAAEAFFVEFERFGHVVEHAQVIHNQAMRLFVAVGAVDARDGLQRRHIINLCGREHNIITITNPPTGDNL